MRILFFIKYYSGYINYLENAIKAGNLNDYESMLSFCIGESSNILTPHLRILKSRGFNATLIIPNSKALQKQWCLENNVEFDNAWEFTVSKKQIEAFKPDILFSSSNFEYYDDFFTDIRPKVGKICAWISCPMPKDLVLNNIDQIFTLFTPHYEYFIKMGKSCTLTTGAFDEDLLHEFGAVGRKINLSFIGGVSTIHKERIEVLKYVSSKTDLNCWGYGFKSTNVLKDFYKYLMLGADLRNSYQGEAWGRKMFEILFSSILSLNVHGDIAKGFSVNMRLFEGTGAGTLLFTESTSDISKLFTPFEEIICFDSKQDLVEKIKYYSKNEKEREEIARNGQQKTLNNFTYQKLNDDYISIFRQILNNEESNL